MRFQTNHHHTEPPPVSPDVAALALLDLPPLRVADLDLDPLKLKGTNREASLTLADRHRLHRGDMSYEEWETFAAA